MPQLFYVLTIWPLFHSKDGTASEPVALLILGLGLLTTASAIRWVHRKALVDSGVKSNGSTVVNSVRVENRDPVRIAVSHRTSVPN
jgi:hypothetical protein